MLHSLMTLVFRCPKLNMIPANSVKCFSFLVWFAYLFVSFFCRYDNNFNTVWFDSNYSWSKYIWYSDVIQLFCFLIEINKRKNTKYISITYGLEYIKWFTFFSYRFMRNKTGRVLFEKCFFCHLNRNHIKSCWFLLSIN